MQKIHQIAIKQNGVALIIFTLVLVLAVTTYFFSQLSASDIKIERDKKTFAALTEAKLALIGFAARSGTAFGTARPGDLPCPDINNDGVAEPSCGNAAGTTQQANRLGRLPWITLGLSDLRDGDGERLWYAVSSRYKLNTRFYPLNSDTQGTITLRNAAGNIINNGSLNSGLVAVVFSPGTAIRRQDAVYQVRDIANQNNAVNYLDVALGEDNQSFVDGNLDGFINGPIKDANGDLILNDQLVSLTQQEIMKPVEQRVIAAVSNALLDYYCAPDVANYATKNCSGVSGNQFYPRPALFTDPSCLATVDIVSPDCLSDVVVTHGRLPVTLATGIWNATSILRGTTSSNNWFQRNGWREHIHYAVAPACVDGTLNCDGAGGFLTLNFARTPTSRIVVTTAGMALTGQLRATNANKALEVNYFEDENATPLDSFYTQTAAGLFNDRSVNIPQ